MKTYTLGILELSKRPDIRTDRYGVYNKMTDAELIQHDKDIDEMLDEEGIAENRGAAATAKHVDFDILFRCILLGKKKYTNSIKFDK
ncbi:MAG: hypothetical protein WC979_03095 [Candidatus Pacearchaeota archaeon]|jgi:hypothetical protein|nr:hypothetical protein [Clostridia bacterium]